MRENLKIVRATIVLAPMSVPRELREALQAGASNWLTLPVTPQQVTAGLAATLRGGIRLNWDETSCLPIASLEGNTRPAIAFTPAGGTDLFSLAWMLRRFARGYDDVVWAAGQIVLLPRVPPEQLEAVRARIEVLLAGRCRGVVVPPGRETHVRINLAG